MAMAHAVTARIERPMSPGAVWSRRLGFFSFVLFLTIALAHRFGLVETPDLVPLFGVTLGFAALAFAVGLNAHRRYWYYGDRGGADIFWGFFWSLATVAPFALLAYWYFAYPKLVDVSTDMDDPPAMAAAARLRTAGMNPIVAPTPEQAATQEEAYPLIEGRRYELGLDRVLPAVETLLAERGWTVTGSQDSVGVAVETTIEAVASSAVLAMPSDVAIRVADEGTATFVDMRSVSRYGSHDFGDNAALVAAFLADLDAEMTNRAAAPSAKPAENGDAADADAPPAEGDLPTPEGGGVPAPEPRPDH